VLVSLGIVILLGGIWVVSIQPDGGGIDVGTWDEEIVQLDPEELEVVPIYAEPNEVTSTSDTVPLIERPTIIRRQRTLAMKRGTRSESSITDVAEEEGLGGRQTQPSRSPNTRPQRAETLYTSPRIPSIASRSSTVTSDSDYQLRYSSPKSQYLARAVSHPHALTTQSISSPFILPPHLHGTLSPPLGAGLQIGLSPLSPGFVILPVERRRASIYTAGVAEGSSSGSINGNNPPGNVERTRFWDLQRRRTVSDSAGSRMNWAPVETEITGHGADADTEAAQEIHTDQPTSPITSDVHSVGRAKARWRWLRNVFRDRS
jgi:hypothetical protein